MINLKNLINFLFIFFIYFMQFMPASIAKAEVRYNYKTHLFEGNKCVTRFGWQLHIYQPLGSWCDFKMKNGLHTTGIIQG
jgi:hypothetical protein